MEWIQRRDRAAKNNHFEQSTIGHTLSFSNAIRSIKNQEIRLTSAYRQLQISDTSLTVLKPDETLLGRLDYTFNFLNGLCTGNLLYELVPVKN